MKTMKIFLGLIFLSVMSVNAQTYDTAYINLDGDIVTEMPDDTAGLAFDTADMAYADTAYKIFTDPIGDDVNDFNKFDEDVEYDSTKVDVNLTPFDNNSSTIDIKIDESYIEKEYHFNDTLTETYYVDSNIIIEVIKNKKPIKGDVKMYAPTIYITITEKNDVSTNNSVFDNREPEFKIYPNPTTDFVQVSVDNVDYRIFNTSGQVVKQSVNHTGQIDVSDLNNGVYIFQTNIGGEAITRKIIKK